MRLTRMSNRRRQRIGIVLAVIFIGSILLITVSPAGEWLLAPGAMMPGHESLLCEDCHRKTTGTIRQQIQAKVNYWIGNQSNVVEFGHNSVGNDNCLNCHRRPNDVHPIYRFLEPRYREARQKIAPQYCVSCHKEHRQQRLSMDQDKCNICHDKIALKKDPLDISHKKLAKDKQWSTCLGCHDFHGNHTLNLPKNLEKRISDADIVAYFKDGKSPYPVPKKYKAKESLQNENE